MLRYRTFLWSMWLSERLPRTVVYLLAALIAEVAFVINGSARRVAAAHMQTILGPSASRRSVLRAARGCFRAAAWYYADLVLMPRLDPVRFNARNIHDTGFEHVERAVRAGRGAVLVSLHYGGPEYVAQCLPARGLRLMELVEPLDPPGLGALFNRYRTRHGNQVVEVGIGGVKRALRHLRSGGAVAVLIDRDVHHTGVRVPFFGRPARVSPGAIDLALHTGAPVIPIITRRRGFDHFEVTIEPPLEMERTGDPRADRRVNTARLIRRFEPHLRRDPAQWFEIEEPIWSCGCEGENGNADG
jgi:KDO2-lipid IV(A) lauroyltransferase